MTIAPRASGESGQALPLALIAMALGALLVAPFLTNVSVNLLAARRDGVAVQDGYATDSGVEWGLWRLLADPALTTSPSYTELPLQPTPVSVNGDAFPTTEVRRVSSSGSTYSYDLRSVRGDSTITARISASAAGVTVVSWQVD